MSFLSVRSREERSNRCFSLVWDRRFQLLRLLFDCCFGKMQSFKWSGNSKERFLVLRTEWCEGIHCRKRIDVAIHRDAVYPFQLYDFT